MPALNYISFTPFGRGTYAGTTRITVPYATVQTLVNTTKLNSTNLAKNAGWHESNILFGSDSTGVGHQHSRYNLARFSVGSRQLNKVKYPVADPDANTAPVIFTNNAGVLTLFGKKEKVMAFPSSESSVTVTVDFVQDGYTKEAFLPGTIPTVLVTPWVTATTPKAHAIRAYVTYASDSEFQVVVTQRTDMDQYAAADLRQLDLFWVAFGLPPGLIAQPAEKALTP